MKYHKRIESKLKEFARVCFECNYMYFDFEDMIKKPLGDITISYFSDSEGNISNAKSDGKLVEPWMSTISSKESVNLQRCFSISNNFISQHKVGHIALENADIKNLYENKKIIRQITEKKFITTILYKVMDFSTDYCY